MERISSTPDRLDRAHEDPLLWELFPALATDVAWGLGRTERALALLGNPQRSFASLHIGGTNGKGSVTATLASVATAAGHRAGSYTSPHLVAFPERIRIDGRAIGDDALREYAAEVRDAVSSCGLTFFEAVTVLALHSFAREAVEVAALEVGLGGRLDATNVVLPEVSAVTNVAMDHADYLGDTLAEIAREKAGIMKPGVPFVTTETAPEVLALFERVADEVDTTLHVVRQESIRDIAVAAGHTAFTLTTESWGDLQIVTPLVGVHQATNAALAVTVCERLVGGFRPEAEHIVRGVAEVDHRGRDEVVVLDGRTWVFDVAHNTAGMESLVDTIERLDLPRPLVAVVGVLADKDWRSMLPRLMTAADHTLLTQPPTAPARRRWNPAAAATALAGRWTPEAIEDFAAALDRARGLTGTGTVVVTGSVHTVGDAMRALDIAPIA